MAMEGRGGGGGGGRGGGRGGKKAKAKAKAVAAANAAAAAATAKKTPHSPKKKVVNLKKPIVPPDRPVPKKAVAVAAGASIAAATAAATTQAPKGSTNVSLESASQSQPKRKRTKKKKGNHAVALVTVPLAAATTTTSTKSTQDQPSVTASAPAQQHSSSVGAGSSGKKKKKKIVRELATSVERSEASSGNTIASENDSPRPTIKATKLKGIKTDGSSGMKRPLGEPAEKLTQQKRIVVTRGASKEIESKATTVMSDIANTKPKRARAVSSDETVLPERKSQRLRSLSDSSFKQPEVPTQSAVSAQPTVLATLVEEKREESSEITPTHVDLVQPLPVVARSIAHVEDCAPEDKAHIDEGQIAASEEVVPVAIVPDSDIVSDENHAISDSRMEEPRVVVANQALSSHFDGKSKTEEVHLTPTTIEEAAKESVSYEADCRVPDTLVNDVDNRFLDTNNSLNDSVGLPTSDIGIVENESSGSVVATPEKQDLTVAIPGGSTMDDAIAVSGSDTETDDDTVDLDQTVDESCGTGGEIPSVPESAEVTNSPGKTEINTRNEPTTSLGDSHSGCHGTASPPSMSAMSSTDPAAQASSHQPNIVTPSLKPTKPAISISSLAMQPIELLKTDGSYLSALFGAPPVEPTPKTQPKKRTWDEVWGPSFGITPSESSSGQAQEQESDSHNVTPLSSWFFSKGPANFKRRVQMPKDTRPSKIARFGGSSPRARVSTSLRLPGASTIAAVSSGNDVDALACQSSRTGAKSEDQPSSFDRFLQDLTVTSAWRSWYGNFDPDSLLDPPLPSSVVSKLEPILDLLSTPVRSEPVSPSNEETEATGSQQTRKRHRMLDELEEAIQEEKKRARAFEQDLLSLLQGKTLSGRDLDECIAIVRGKQSAAPSHV